MWRRYIVKYGIEIPREAKIGYGFWISHYGGIILNGSVVIGNNCNISQGVTIGIGGRGDKRGNPVIGDNVYIGPGAKVFGKIRIGNNAAIGANAVVTKDVPDNATVGGIPATVINMKGSDGMINNRWTNDYQNWE